MRNRVGNVTVMEWLRSTMITLFTFLWWRTSSVDILSFITRRSCGWGKGGVKEYDAVTTTVPCP